MHTSEKHEPWITLQKPDLLLWTHSATTPQHAVCGLLEDPGNCRQSTQMEQSLHLLTDSVVSEKQKLRHVLNWAETVLCSRSEVCNEFCRADGLLLADAKQRETEKDSPAYEHSAVAEYYHCTAGNKRNVWDEIYEVYHLKSSNCEHNSKEKNRVCGYKSLSQNEPLFLRSCSLRKDEETWLESRETERIRSTELQHATHKQTSHQDRTRRPHKSHQRLHKETLDCSATQTLASGAATWLIKESSAVSTVQTLHESNGNTETKAGARSKKDKSENQLSLKKVVERMENNEEELKVNDRQKENHTEKIYNDQICNSESEVQTCNMSHSQKEKIPEQEAEAADLSFTPRVKLWSDLSVVEQYQLCVDQLHHLRTSQRNKCGFLTQSTQKQASAPTLQLNRHISSHENKRHDDNAGKTVTAAETTEERRSQFTGKNRDAAKSSKDLTTHEAQSCDDLTANKTTAAIRAGGRPVTLNGKQSEGLLKKTANSIITNNAVINTPAEHLRTKSEDFAEPGLQQNKIRRPPSGKSQQTAGTGPERTNEAPGPQRLCENSSSTSSGRLLPRNNPKKFTHSARLSSQKSTNTANSRVRHFLSGKDAQRISRTTQTHKLQQEPMPPAKGTISWLVLQPAGVPVCDHWLSLPDEVWLSILSLVPQRDLSSVSQVCHRLHTLSADHTLWKNLKVENSAVTDQWLLCAGQRRPHSLSLHSCSSQSVSSCGLQMFFCLCWDSLEELKVTSCLGPGVHGDQVLSLIGQLCENLTSVDVSWSGATDTGLEALGDCSKRLRLKSVLLNGCRVTDDPVRKLVMKHKESLHRLEVFGCQFLSASCLQTVYETCLGLQHLNIGRVPKVNAYSFTVMASRLKCLISLNLTGLQVVDDAVVDTVLQNCVTLQSLTLSSCSGVTDVTLHSISKYTPCIRSLDVSGCAAVTDAGLQSLALGCRRLEQLDLSSTGTGNRGVSLLANYCSANLHTVKLSFCHITAENILKLCRNCRRLKVLHLYGCVHLPTARGIREANGAVQVYPPLGPTSVNR